MPQYLVELYVAAGALHEVQERAAATELGGDVRCLHSIYVPDEETWFLLYEAPTRADVVRALDGAGLPPPRVVNLVA